jgi:dipeptidyl aminopeptidase/acylaminoacyl peptidase
MGPSHVLSLVLLSLTVLSAPSQAGAPAKTVGHARQPFLGQAPPRRDPALFAPDIVSTQNMEHSRLVFSPDGREIYWAVVPAPINEAIDETRIMCVREGSTGWREPAPLPFAAAGSRSPALSPDGRRLYFVSSAPGTGGGGGAPRQAVWEVERGNGGWGRPRVATRLPKLPPGKMTLALSFAANGNLYFDVGGPGETGRWVWAIYVAEVRNGRYGEPQPLGAPVNEGRVNQNPFVAPDESFMLFSSWREGSLGGGDLYVSFRRPGREWSQPRRLPEGVNTRAQERFPSMSPDGRYLFFNRSGGESLDDVYWVSAGVIDSLRTPGD